MNLDKYRLNSEEMILFVIDIQEKLSKAMDPKIENKVIKNSSILIETAKQFDIPILFSEQYPKGLGKTVEELSFRVEKFSSLEKTYFDCMKDSSIVAVVKKSSKKTVVLAGMETHVCVFQTAISLLEFGYKVVIASDAVSSRRKDDWAQALKTLNDAGALIYPTETISFMVLEKAGTDQFKKISPMFK